MFKESTRILALFLVSAIIADPATATSFVCLNVPLSQNLNLQSHFEDQALAALALSHTFERRLRSSNSLERLELKWRGASELKEQENRLHPKPQFKNGTPTTEEAVKDIQHALSRLRWLGVSDLQVVLYGRFAEEEQKAWDDLDYFFLPRANMSLTRLSFIKFLFEQILHKYRFDPQNPNPLLFSQDAVEQRIHAIKESRLQRHVWVISDETSRPIDIYGANGLQRAITSLKEKNLGFIKGPHTTQEQLSRWLSKIRDDSDVVEKNNEDIVKMAVDRIRNLEAQQGDILEILEENKTSPIDINNIQFSLQHPKASFHWFLSFVNGREDYLLGVGTALAVDVIQFLLAEEVRMDVHDLVEEYILHELLENSKIDHSRIIQITNTFFSRQDKNPLKAALRMWIDMRFRESLRFRKSRNAISFSKENLRIQEPSPASINPDADTSFRTEKERNISDFLYDSLRHPDAGVRSATVKLINEQNLKSVTPEHVALELMAKQDWNGLKKMVVENHIQVLTALEIAVLGKGLVENSHFSVASKAAQVLSEIGAKKRGDDTKLETILCQGAEVILLEGLDTPDSEDRLAVLSALKNLPHYRTQTVDELLRMIGKNSTDKEFVIKATELAAWVRLHIFNQFESGTVNSLLLHLLLRAAPVWSARHLTFVKWAGMAGAIGEAVFFTHLAPRLGPIFMAFLLSLWIAVEMRLLYGWQSRARGEPPVRHRFAWIAFLKGAAFAPYLFSQILAPALHLLYDYTLIFALLQYPVEQKLPEPIENPSLHTTVFLPDLANELLAAEPAFPIGPWVNLSDTFNANSKALKIKADQLFQLYGFSGVREISRLIEATLANPKEKRALAKRSSRRALVLLPELKGFLDQLSEDQPKTLMMTPIFDFSRFLPIQNEGILWTALVSILFVFGSIPFSHAQGSPNLSDYDNRFIFSLLAGAALFGGIWLLRSYRQRQNKSHPLVLRDRLTQFFEGPWSAFIAALQQEDPKAPVLSQKMMMMANSIDPHFGRMMELLVNKQTYLDDPVIVEGLRKEWNTLHETFLIPRGFFIPLEIKQSHKAFYYDAVVFEIDSKETEHLSIEDSPATVFYGRKIDHTPLLGSAHYMPTGANQIFINLDTITAKTKKIATALNQPLKKKTNMQEEFMELMQHSFDGSSFDAIHQVVKESARRSALMNKTLQRSGTPYSLIPRYNVLMHKTHADEMLIKTTSDLAADSLNEIAHSKHPVMRLIDLGVDLMSGEEDSRYFAAHYVLSALADLPVRNAIVSDEPPRVIGIVEKLTVTPDLATKAKQLFDEGFKTSPRSLPDTPLDEMALERGIHALERSAPEVLQSEILDSVLSRPQTLEQALGMIQAMLEDIAVRFARNEELYRAQVTETMPEAQEILKHNRILLDQESSLKKQKLILDNYKDIQEGKANVELLLRIEAAHQVYRELMDPRKLEALTQDWLKLENDISNGVALSPAQRARIETLLASIEKASPAPLTRWNTYVAGARDYLQDRNLFETDQKLIAGLPHRNAMDKILAERGRAFQMIKQALKEHSNEQMSEPILDEKAAEMQRIIELVYAPREEAEEIAEANTWEKQHELARNHAAKNGFTLTDIECLQADSQLRDRTVGLSLIWETIEAAQKVFIGRKKSAEVRLDAALPSLLQIASLGRQHDIPAQAVFAAFELAISQITQADFTVKAINIWAHFLYNYSHPHAVLTKGEKAPAASLKKRLENRGDSEFRARFLDILEILQTHTAELPKKSDSQTILYFNDKSYTKEQIAFAQDLLAYEMASYHLFPVVKRDKIIFSTHDSEVLRGFVLENGKNIAKIKIRGDILADKEKAEETLISETAHAVDSLMLNTLGFEPKHLIPTTNKKVYEVLDFLRSEIYKPGTIETVAQEHPGWNLYDPDLFDVRYSAHVGALNIAMHLNALLQKLSTEPMLKERLLSAMLTLINLTRTWGYPVDPTFERDRLVTLLTSLSEEKSPLTKEQRTYFAEAVRKVLKDLKAYEIQITSGLLILGSLPQQEIANIADENLKRLLGVLDNFEESDERPREVVIQDIIDTYDRIVWRFVDQVIDAEFMALKRPQDILVGLDRMIAHAHSLIGPQNHRGQEMLNALNHDLIATRLALAQLPRSSGDSSSGGGVSGSVPEYKDPSSDTGPLSASSIYELLGQTSELALEAVGAQLNTFVYGQDKLIALSAGINDFQIEEIPMPSRDELENEFIRLLKIRVEEKHTDRQKYIVHVLDRLLRVAEELHTPWSLTQAILQWAQEQEPAFLSDTRQELNFRESILDLLRSMDILHTRHTETLLSTRRSA